MGCRSVPSRPPEARLRSEVAGPAFGAPTELLARAITADVLGRREVRGYVGEVDGEAAVTASEVGYGVHERVGFTTPGTPALLGLASLSWPVRRPGTVAVQLERVAVRPMIPPTARRTRIRPDREERVAFRRPAAGRSPASIRSYSWPSITKASALASSYGNPGPLPTVDDANAPRRLSTPKQRHLPRRRPRLRRVRRRRRQRARVQHHALRLCPVLPSCLGSHADTLRSSRTRSSPPAAPRCPAPR